MWSSTASHFVLDQICTAPEYSCTTRIAPYHVGQNHKSFYVKHATLLFEQAHKTEHSRELQYKIFGLDHQGTSPYLQWFVLSGAFEEAEKTLIRKRIEKTFDRKNICMIRE